MIDEVLERAQDDDGFALLALGLLSATAELERLSGPGPARADRVADGAGGDGEAERRATPAFVTADDPCLLAVLGLLGFARRFRELLTLVEDEPGVGETPRAGADPAPAPAPPHGSLLR